MNSPLWLVMLAICQIESSGIPNAMVPMDGNSPSYGSCQIKLSTARFVGYKGHVSKLWLDETTNKFIAYRYLRYQYKRYNNDLIKAISAYNTGSIGPKGITNPTYVNKVLHQLQR